VGPADLDPKERFTDRVEDYVKYRPGYPRAILHFLEGEAGLTEQTIVADVGSGPGNLSLLFLDQGNLVYGVEPNAAMRAAAESRLAGYANFISVDGSAESTGLPEDSVDLVTAGQAFHWFEADLARREFRRILRPEGSVALAWNDWSGRPSPFMQAYEALVERYGLGYQAVKHSNASGPERIADFFAEGSLVEVHYDTHQLVDLDRLRGRLMSASYAPKRDHPNYEPMMAELDHIFERFQVGGRVRFAYDTVVFAGRI
jgi:SAM-dependent methyltransferase